MGWLGSPSVAPTGGVPAPVIANVRTLLSPPSDGSLVGFVVPDVIVCSDGSWLLAYNDSNAGFIKTIRSRDGGVTWGSPVTVLQNTAPDPILLKFGSALLMSFVKPDHTSVSGSCVIRSSDNGATWSTPPVFVGLSAGGASSDAAGGGQWTTDGSNIWAAFFNVAQTKAFLFKSTDGGMTWTNQSTMDPNGLANECGLAYLGNGALRAVLRSNSGSATYTTVSTDSGTTWAPLTDITQQVGGALQYPNLYPMGSRLVMVARLVPNQVVAYCSSNGGVSWGDPLLIERYVGSNTSSGYCHLYPLSAGRAIATWHAIENLGVLGPSIRIGDLAITEV